MSPDLFVIFGSLALNKTYVMVPLLTRHELLEEACRQGLPFASWDGPTVVSWLEVLSNQRNLRDGKIVNKDQNLDFLIFSSVFCLLPAVGGHARLVRRSLSRQREERRHHGQPVGHRDPEGDRHQQPTSPPQTAAGHPGDGVPHQPVSPGQHSLCETAHTFNIQIRTTNMF